MAATWNALGALLDRLEKLVERIEAVSTVKRLFDYDEAAHYAGIAKRSISDQVTAGLPVRKYGTKPLIERKDLDALIDRWPYE